MRTRTLRLMGLATLASTAFFLPHPAAAIDWDDAGNDASKNWDDNGNWNPDGDPDGLAVNIGNLANAANDRTLIDRAYSITSLNITAGADVVNSTDDGATNDFLLIVSGATTIGDAGSSVVVYGADPFFFSSYGLLTGSLTLNSGGSLVLNSTTAQGTAITSVSSGIADVNAGGTITGTGVLRLDDNPAVATTLLINDGTITANTSPGLIFQAPAAGTLQIVSADADARFDWDGGGNGVLNVNGNQTLDIDVQPGSGASSDAFSGTMNLATGGTIDIAHSWELDSGTINANTPDFGLIIIGTDPSPGAGAHIAGAAWTMTGGTVNVDSAWDTLILDSNLTATGGVLDIVGTLQVNGTATLGGGATLTPSGGADLVVNGTMSIAQATFDWDGFATTNVNDGASLTITSPDIDTSIDGYDGTLNINGGTATVNTAWTMENATINMNTSATDSDLSGGVITVASDAARINVTGSGAASADVNAALVIDNALDVFIDPGTTLNLSVNTINALGTTWQGGAGSILRNGTATVNAVTTYDMAGGTVDLDDGNDVLNAQLTINADSIDDSGDGVDGTLTINNSGTLLVNLTGNAPWGMDGVLNYNGDAVSGTIVGGSSPARFEGTSTLNVNGEGAITSVGLFRGTVNINSAGEDLELFGGDQTSGGANVMSGATINGPGEMAVDDGQALRGNGTINAPFRGDGSAQLIAEGGVLNVAGGIVSVGTIGTSGAAGVLNVTNPWSTNVAGLVVLDQGTVQGAAILNNGNGFRGQGVILSQINNNASIISTTPGTLRVSNAGNDWDGGANTGVLRATQGLLELNDNAPFLFNGTVQADGGTVFANGFELEFEPASTLVLSNGAYRSSAPTDFGGAMNVLPGTATISVGGSAIFEATSNSNVAGTLKLDNPATRINAGATFAGGGELQNVGGRVLQLEDGANVNVLVHNAGALEFGGIGVAAQTIGLDFQQDASGLFNVDLGGLGAAQSDRMGLTGIATLAGALDIDLIGGFVPALGNAITILSAAGGVSGTFTSVSEPAGLPAGTLFDVVYQPTFVQLVLKSAPLFSADFDVDGDVDGADLTVWNGAFGLGNGADADHDGDSDGRDFLAWQRQYGSVPVVAAIGSVPEPGTWALATIAGVSVLACRRRGRD